MSKFTFRKASKGRAKLRMAFVGPAGSGKTYSALSVAQHLGERIAVIDTEHGSSEKYADEFNFDVLTLDTYSPLTYVDAINAAEEAGYDVIITDSLSHAWMGKDGALELADKAKRNYGGNKWSAWGDVTPMHQKLIEAMLGCKAHFIATMRSKTEWVVEEDDRGRKKPRKIGMQPVQRDGLDYEFDVCGDIDLNHTFAVSKSRCRDVDGKTFHNPGESLALILKNWLTDGVDHDAKSTELVAAMQAVDDVKKWAKAHAAQVQALPAMYRKQVGDACRAELAKRGQGSNPGQEPQESADAAQ